MANFIGNNDYRGYLAYLAQNGDGNASTALNFAGNDGGYDDNKLQSYYDSPTENRSAERDALIGYIGNTYNSWAGQTDGDGGGTYSGGTASAPAYDPQQLAVYDQAIGQANLSVGRLDNQQNIGQQNINDSYNSSLNKLLSSKALADRDYNDTKLQSTQDNVTAKSNIDFATGRRANSLQRLLGAKGAGSSSASRTAAPYAAALEGSQQRRQVSDAFGRNMGSLDKEYGDFNTNYQSSNTELGEQKGRNERELQSTILEKRNGLLQTLAQLQGQRASLMGGSAVGSAQPYLDQINSNNSTIDSLGNQFANRVNVQAPTYAAPELAKYNYDRSAAPQFGGSSALTENISPYLSLLLGQRKKDNQSF